MANDPTARHAEKALAAAGMTDTVAINDNEPVRVTRATARTLMSLLDIQYSPVHGAFFATLKEDAPSASGNSPEGNNTDGATNHA